MKIYKKNSSIRINTNKMAVNSNIKLSKVIKLCKEETEKPLELYLKKGYSKEKVAQIVAMCNLYKKNIQVFTQDKDVTEETKNLIHTLTNGEYELRAQENKIKKFLRVVIRKYLIASKKREVKKYKKQQLKIIKKRLNAK